MDTIICIKEQVTQVDDFLAAVSFDYGKEYPIIVRSPFNEKQERELEWYFEEHLQFPFIQKVRAKDAAGSIINYGETLFKQVFQNNLDVYAKYTALLDGNLEQVQIEIVGSPKFHTLHWEALKDPEHSISLALQSSIVRKSLQPQNSPTFASLSPTINLLIVTARPHGKSDVGYRTISRPLVEALRRARLPIRINILRPGTYIALENHLQEITRKHGEGYYHVIHFDTHGGVINNKAFLFFESEQDSGSEPVKATELAHLLRSHHIPIAILNACQSGKQIGERETSLGSRLMQAGVDLVLAMSYSVTVSAAERLMTVLYKNLAVDNLALAIHHARTELYNDKKRRVYFDQTIELEDWLLPVVYQNQPQHLRIREFTPEESKAYHQRKAELSRSRTFEPRYGFVGRDLDILQIEKHLLTKRNILLVRGMGGSGKTTLFLHLENWWRTTGLVNWVFYFGYDEKAWTLQQILDRLARECLGEAAYLKDFQPLSLDAQEALLTKLLNAESHLLILDNLESITGDHLAIQHKLSRDEQEKLYHFLTNLSGGRTLVLLGSRSGEDWLARGTFEGNVYELGGLDSEAASALTERILEQYNVTKYREDEDLLRLLTLLDGFPLALEVVLTNLARKTPKEVVTALKMGNVTLDQGNSQQKTESILRCIDYSHSNLTPEAQNLLTCLSPFTSIFDLNLLNTYSEHLKQQPILAALPFDNWLSVFKEMQNSGLITPDPNSHRYFRLHPILPYFLRTRLAAPEQAGRSAAIHTAFRQLYSEYSSQLQKLLSSEEPQEQRTGQVIVHFEYENLMTALDQALVIQTSIDDMYVTLSSYLDVNQEQPRGLELAQTVLKGMETYPDDKLFGDLQSEFIMVLYDIARRHSVLKQFEAAEASYKKVLSVMLEKMGLNQDQFRRASATIYYSMGIIAQSQRKFEQAEQYFQQVLQTYIDYNKRHEQADIYYHLGTASQQQRKFQQAEQYLQQALQIEVDYSDRREQAGTYETLGMVARDQQKFEQAEYYLQRALQIEIDYDHRYEQAGTYFHLGSVAQDQRKFEQAEQYYQQALQIDIDYGDRYEQANSFLHLGNVFQEQEKFEQAEQYYQQALQIYIDYDDRYGQANTCYNLGSVAWNQQKFEQARSYFLSTLETFLAYRDSYYAIGSLLGLARLWETSRDMTLVADIADILQSTTTEVETHLRKLLEKNTTKKEKDLAT